jgi:hypothetical protein
LHAFTSASAVAADRHASNAVKHASAAACVSAALAVASLSACKVVESVVVPAPALHAVTAANETHPAAIDQNERASRRCENVRDMDCSSLR